MLLIPAIDLKDGRCVRLRQGDLDDATVFSEDPAAMAERARDYGAKAHQALEPFPDSEIKTAMIEAVEFAIHRSY